MDSGSLDFCTQSHCDGWAAQGSQPAKLLVYINDDRVAEVQCSLDRPDLVAHGLPRLAGFSYSFPRPLRLHDRVDVRFDSGVSLPNSPSVQHRERLERLQDGIGVNEKGLELGPLNRPILSKSDFNVFYVDHASKADLLLKYNRSGSVEQVRSASLVEVDFVWNDGRLIDATGPGYAYCLASHVIEHVADPIGWLQEIAAVLKPGGRFNLAIPERTRTFDHLRTPSIPAAMIDAHHRKLRRPSFGQIFDHVSGVAPFGGALPDRRQAVTAAYRSANAAEASGDYVDIHCHVWTHDSFLECWSVIETLGLVPLKLTRSMPATGPWNEFTVMLVKV